MQDCLNVLPASNSDIGNEDERGANLRSKPLTGTLRVTLRGARELDHAPITTRFRTSSRAVTETYVSIKVEGTQLARSHPSRTDRWNEEFEMTVDKANEVEIVVYDKQGNDQHPIPIGILWIKISDLVEALRRQKVGMETSQGGWFTAGAMPGDGQGRMQGPPGQGGIDAPLNQPGVPGAPGGFGGAPFGVSGTEGVDAWFAIEPAGAIALHLNFSMSLFNKFSEDEYLTILSQRKYSQEAFGRAHGWFG